VFSYQQSVSKLNNLIQEINKLYYKINCLGKLSSIFE